MFNVIEYIIIIVKAAPCSLAEWSSGSKSTAHKTVCWVSVTAYYYKREKGRSYT